MAAVASSAALCSVAAAPMQKQYEGLRATSVKCHMLPVVKSQSRVQCGYIGSPTNLIMVGAITAQLLAGRFGLAPAANRKANAGLKLVDRDTGLETGDPAAFTATDTLAHGAVGHILGVGIVLGLKNLGII